jgi:predicted ATPase
MQSSDLQSKVRSCNLLSKIMPSWSKEFASPRQSTPMLEYEKLVDAGTLTSDDYQTQIIQKLQALHDALAIYDPPPPVATFSFVNIPFYLRFVFG